MLAFVKISLRWINRYFSQDTTIEITSSLSLPVTLISPVQILITINIYCNSVLHAKNINNAIGFVCLIGTRSVLQRKIC